MDVYMRKSLEAERAFSDAIRKRDEMAHIGMYGLADKYDADAKRYRKESDDWFALHKKHTDLFDNSVMEMCIAIVRQATRDYEAWLCRPDGEDRRRELKELEKFLTPTLVNRVREGKTEFVQKAHDSIDDLIITTAFLKKYRIAASDDRNPIRCPNCGGGMYVRTRKKDSCLSVGCSTCSLFVYVKRGGKPDAT